MITIQDLRTWNTPLSESPIKVQTFFRSLKKKFRVSSITGNFWSQEEPLTDGSIVHYTGLNLFYFEAVNTDVGPFAGYLYNTDWCYLLVTPEGCYKVDVDFVSEEINSPSVTSLLATGEIFSRFGRARHITLDELFDPWGRSCPQLDKLFESFENDALSFTFKYWVEKFPEPIKAVFKC